MKWHDTFSRFNPQVTDGRCKYSELAILYSCNDVVLRLGVLGGGGGGGYQPRTIKSSMLEYVGSILKKDMRILSYDRKELGRDCWEPGNVPSSSIKEMALNWANNQFLKIHSVPWNWF
jgi:hypothetical protein